MQRLVIAIDGPSGVGKSSTSRGVATRLGLKYLDTGSMYRATAWACAQADVLDDPLRILATAQTSRLSVGTDPAHPTIAVDGTDVSGEIRSPELSAEVSKVATVQAVRDLLTAQMQQIIAAEPRVVVEGRDATTVICPDAEVRVLLSAAPLTRLQRRAAQLGEPIDEDTLRDVVLRRDADDATMSEFATPAPGVHLIDSTDLNLAEVVAAVIALVPPALRSAPEVAPVE